MVRYVAALALCGCTSDIVVPPGGGGGEGQGAVASTGGAPVANGGGGQGGDGANGGIGADGGSGGEGGSQRTVLVDVDMPAGFDADEVVILVSAPDGTVTSSWKGGELPVDAPANNGDLVSYLYRSGTWSYAQSFRVTPSVSEVETTPWLRRFGPACETQPPMTISFTIPEVDGALDYRVATAGATFLPMSAPSPGTQQATIRACVGESTFDLLLVVREYANTEVIAFARVDDIPYAPGTTAEIPLELSTARELVDVVVDAEPGTDFKASAIWNGDAFRVVADSSFTQTIGTVGFAGFSYGPFAIGPEPRRVHVMTPPSFNCEIEHAWKSAPFDDTPLHLMVGSLAEFADTGNGSIALAPDGEVGDVLIRSEDEYTTDTPAYWALYEDPETYYPLPAQPQVPAGMLPEFEWPNSSAEIRLVNRDVADVAGYADYVRVNSEEAAGRARERVPQYCW
ncbi:MAG: hypothetical protein HOW73_37495 [Polyangiaceae bacterium]|nr:hypothetical protein [Polyangiaceae bacterium]